MLPPVLYWLKYYVLQILVTQLLRLTNMICFFVYDTLSGTQR